MNNQQFAGKVVFITGATSGIGRATAIAFGAAGAKVACVGRKENALEAVVREISSGGSEVIAIRSELSQEGSPAQAISRALEAFGGIDVLINAAGHISSGTIENTTIRDWDEMMNVN